MTINQITEGSRLTLILEGRLDTTTAPELEAVVKTETKGMTEVVMDFEKLVYLSSAGLRVILAAQKLMNQQGSLEIWHVNDTIMEVFEVTGFTNVLTIKE